MNNIKVLNERDSRLFEKLYGDLSELVVHLEEDQVTEIMLNSDGSLWIDQLQGGQRHVGSVSEAKAYAIINGIAGIHNVVVSPRHPRLEAELPCYKSLNGERFTAVIPPIVKRPLFSIRKPAKLVYSLADYVASGRLTESQSHELHELVISRKNILVCGGPGSGKTTVTNALLQIIALEAPDQRLIILEDLPELQCQAKNHANLLSTSDISLTALLKTAMRLRPDRIVVGEVRGAEALDLLKAWNTGCPGGLGTVHANGAEEAVQRLLDLSMEAGLREPPRSLVAHTLDAVVVVDRQNHQPGFIQSIVNFQGSLRA